MNRILNEDLKDIIEQPVKWDKLKNKTVMVTGASGWSAPISYEHF